MMKQDQEKSRAPEGAKSAATRANPERKPKFEPPKVITYSGDDILEELGPAHACNPFSGSVVAC